MTDEEITFEELQKIVNSPLKNKRTIKDFAKTIYDLSNKNKQLEKENEEQKQKISDLTKDKDLLMIRNLDLIRQNENYKMSENESIEIITDLKAENEKLKTCRNCKKEFTETCETCRRGLYDGEFDNWELAE